MNTDKLCALYDFETGSSIIGSLVANTAFLILIISLVIFIKRKIYNSPQLHKKRNLNKILLKISLIVVVICLVFETILDIILDFSVFGLEMATALWLPITLGVSITYSMYFLFKIISDLKNIKKHFMFYGIIIVIFLVTTIFSNAIGIVTINNRDDIKYEICHCCGY